MKPASMFPPPMFLAGVLFVVFALTPAPALTATYGGSEKCHSCHEKEYSRWKNSHHYQAMLPASDETVLGDFSGSGFEYAGIRSRFYKKDGRFHVETDNAKGELQEFEISYTFGFYPLQQYLVPFPDGRYQALNIVWDSRPEAEGGQRWVHLYPDQRVTHEHGLHWTGSFQNWNSRCATCHSTRLEKSYSSATDTYKTHSAEINVGCDASVLPELMALANDPAVPGIIRATAVLEIGALPSRKTMQAMQQHLGSEDNLVRAAAARSLGFLPAARRYQMLQPLISDPIKSVRTEVASQLSEFSLAQLPPKYAQELTTLLEEYLETLNLNADMPEAQLNLGNYYTATGDGLKAEQAYRQAIRLSPAFTPALLNLADLYRANGLDKQAASLLQEAVSRSPDDPATHHAMGLALVRQKNLDRAVNFLGKAAELAPASVRYAYVYAVALYESSRHEQAISVLEAALEKQPGNQEIISALGSYYRQQGRDGKLQELIQKYPQ